MRPAGTVLALACAITAGLPARAPGQRAPDDPSAPAVEAGARLGYDWDLDAWSLGAQLRLPVLPGLYVVPSADCYARSPGTSWQLGLDATFRLGWYAGLYGGAGLGLAHRADVSARIAAGLDAFVGFTPPRLRSHRLWPFVEARWLLVKNRSPFRAVLGLDIPLAR